MSESTRRGEEKGEGRPRPTRFSAKPPKAKKKSADGKTPLMRAAEKGDVQKVIGCLAKGENPRARNEAGDTALSLAASNQRLEIVNLFLQRLDNSSTSIKIDMIEALGYKIYSQGFRCEVGFGIPADKDKAVQFYTLAAELGYPAAQFALGVHYGYAENNFVEGIRLYALAAKADYAEAQYNLAICYQKGVGVARDEAQAMYWYHLAAENGCADAQYYLGDCYEQGIGVTADKAEAMRLYQLAVDQGEISAMRDLSNLYEHIAKGANPDTKTFYINEVNRLDGLIADYEQDERKCVVTHKLDEADEIELPETLLIVAAREGRWVAVDYYLQRLGIELEPREVRDMASLGQALYALAAKEDAEIKDALQQRRYEKEDPEIVHNEHRVARLYRIAVRLGCTSALQSLASCYATGTGVTQNKFEATRLYDLAAECENTAQKKIREEEKEREKWRLHGLAIDQKQDEADGVASVEEQLISAATEDHWTKVGECLEQLGIDLSLVEMDDESENGLEQMRVELRVWAKISHCAKQLDINLRLVGTKNEPENCLEQMRVELGLPIAADAELLRQLIYRALGKQTIAEDEFQDGLEQLRIELEIPVATDVALLRQLIYRAAIREESREVSESDRPQHERQVARLYRLAVKLGCTHAYQDLACCYEEGIGVTQNAFEAARLYNLATKNGDSLAEYNLALCYEYGIGVAQKVEWAVDLHKTLANKGYPIAVAHLCGKHPAMRKAEAIREGRWAN